MADVEGWVAATLFDRIVCGVDGSPGAREAARQAAMLVSPTGRLVIVAIGNVTAGAWAGTGADAVMLDAYQATERAVADAREAVESLHDCDVEALTGIPARDLVGEAGRLEAGVLALGPPAQSRLLGAVVGSVATTAIHDYPKSVLVARVRDASGAFPGSIVCGVDGSEPAAAAVAVARELGARFDAPVRYVVAEGGRNVDADAARDVVGSSAAIELEGGKPRDVLPRVADHAGLLVVGSRGLHDARSLGSVCERVAHTAPCSVLIVRR
ncbi:MAG: universal stress protein [Gaiellales bacterium]